jgi:hypothetical protein
MYIYQDQMEQRLEDVCVWSDDMPDVMLVRTHEFKLQIRARITRAWLVKNQENNQTFGSLAHMTEKLPALVQHWHWWGCLWVDACSLPRILQAAWWLTEIKLIQYWEMEPKNLRGHLWTVEHAYRKPFWIAYLNQWKKRVTCWWVKITRLDHMIFTWQFNTWLILKSSYHFHYLIPNS